jgi:RNA 3'-terminal phosphate cyclase-like protein
MQSIQTGCKVEVTSKHLTYIPGIITNNAGLPFDFDCGVDRAVGYYLEPLIILSLFGKTEIKVTLTGFTNDNLD